jgi:hypothetical protein
MKKQTIGGLARRLVIELIVYAALLTVYLFTVLKLLNGLLTRLFNDNLTTYAFLGLGLIVTQGVILDAVTSLIINQLKLDRVE